MCNSFSLQLWSKHFRSDKYVAVYVLDVQETSRRSRRKFWIQTHTYTPDANIHVFTRLVHERARNG